MIEQLFVVIIRKLFGQRIHFYINHQGMKILKSLTHECSVQKRSIWGYVAIAFNQVDNDRLRKVGADRLCAEWLLKNGGAVRFKELPNRLVCDYNILPPESQKLHVQVADASNSSVMKIGLEHFKNCHHIDTVIFHNCKHLEVDSLYGLTHLAKTLHYLQISSCGNLEDESFLPIGQLTYLKCLTLFDLQYVKNIEKLASDIRAKLPKCDVKIEK